MTLPKFSIDRAEQCAFPTCWVCGNPIRRPCSLKTVKLKEPKLVCSGCYKLYMSLSRMAIHGLIEFTEVK